MDVLELISRNGIDPAGPMMLRAQIESHIRQFIAASALVPGPHLPVEHMLRPSKKRDAHVIQQGGDILRQACHHEGHTAILADKEPVSGCKGEHLIEKGGVPIALSTDFSSQPPRETMINSAR
jgi:hypothetical protein